MSFRFNHGLESKVATTAAAAAAAAAVHHFETRDSLARTILISNFVGKHSRFDKRAQSGTAQSKMSQFDKAHVKVFLHQPSESESEKVETWRSCATSSAHNIQITF